jgi:hypothetical protein
VRRCSSLQNNWPSMSSTFLGARSWRWVASSPVHAAAGALNVPVHGGNLLLSAAGSPLVTSFRSAAFKPVSTCMTTRSSRRPIRLRPSAAASIQHLSRRERQSARRIVLHSSLRM